MIGLTILLAFAVYLAVSFAVVRFVIRWAKRNGRSARRWGSAAVLLMYLLVFWDHIPTLLLHKYYCATKAGFWVYKTPEQWKAENPGVAETLTWREQSRYFKNADGSFGLILNDRFSYVTRQCNAYLLPITVSTDFVIDVTSAEVMVERVRVGSGYGGFYKFWVKTESCLPSQSELSQLRLAYKKVGGADNERN